MDDDTLERAIGEWLTRKEDVPDLLPGEFARELPEALRAPFLRELEELAEIDNLTTQEAARDLPRRFGDFRVFGELGRGAMGTVHDAEQVSTGRRVALKVMHPHVARDQQSASRFAREARTAAALQHPGIVAVLAFGTTDGCAWLAMERLEGRSLQRLLAAAGDARDVDHARARRLFDDVRGLAKAIAEVADALEFAHRHGVVHRDIKPANLMYRDDGSMVVLDFGLATAREPESVALTRTGDLLGTPLYMAPEQAVGAENGTPRSDVYSLGAVLYECLCGVSPVAPGPLATVIDSILNREPVPPARRRVGVPEAAGRIAMQCLEKEPGRRYATAEALAKDLRRFVGGASVQARHSGMVGRSLRRLRRRPALAMLAAAVCLLVPIVLVVWGLAARTESRAASLQREVDLRAIAESLGSAPERATVFGGASLRFYARIGLGEAVDDGTSRRSPGAERALQLAEDLHRRHPGDVEVLRSLARARLDVGDDAAGTQAAIDALLANEAATSADLMMAAVWERQCGREAAAQRLRAGVHDDGVATAFWLGFWHQEEQDHEAAIAAFSRALAAPDLDAESRYQALLHRGWCRTCPDVAQLEAARDDLLQAAALRPRYGTARLLWAALRCLEARTTDDLQAPVAAVTEVLREAEPWQHVLTARVLLALAEAGTVQSGPVSFGAEFSPIAVLPVAQAFAAAFAGLALDLLDGVLAGSPGLFEAGFHRSTALALLGRHDDALAAIETLATASPPARQAALALQGARVQAAAGRSGQALVAVRRSLALAPGAVAAWRFQATLCTHLGDATGRLQALERAIAALLAARQESSVFPDAAALLPELQLLRAQVLHGLGRRAEAVELLRLGPFGGVLAGEFSPRVQWQRHQLLRDFAASAPAIAAPLSATSPLRWLAEQSLAVPEVDDAGARVALQRGWLPAVPMRGLTTVATDAAMRDWSAARGLQLPAVVEAAPLRTVLASVAALTTARPAVAEQLLRRAEEVLARDPDNGEARLLRGLVLYVTRRTDEAARFLAASLAEHGDDLRARFLLAIAARDNDDPVLARLALRRGDVPLTIAELDQAAAALPMPVATPGAALLEFAR